MLFKDNAERDQSTDIISETGQADKVTARRDATVMNRDESFSMKLRYN